MTSRLRTTCTRDCPDACGLIATVEDGQVVRLEGDPDHPITQGFLCYRTGSRYLKRHAAAERLTRPLLRTGRGFQPIPWDEALDRTARTLEKIRRESGPAALLHVQGGGSLGLLKRLNALLFRALGATETRGSLCDGAGYRACELDFGVPQSNAWSETLKARGILVWGRDVASSSPHSVPFLKQARREGAEVILVDPRPHPGRRLADRFLQPRQGGDAALALGTARVVLDEGLEDPDVSAYAENLPAFIDLVRSRSPASWAEEADLPVESMLDLARFLKERAPVTGLIGWGLQRRQNGATQLRAVHALFALTGNLGRSGAGPSYINPRSAPFDLSRVKQLEGNVLRTLLLPLLGEEIANARDPEIRAVVIDNANPVVSNPDSESTRKALESREFVVVIDAFMTDTARAADLVLPCTLMLEEDDLVGSYGHHYVSASRAVVKRLEGTRTDLEIYQQLSERLGLGGLLAGSAKEWIDRLSTSLKSGGLTPDRLRDSAETPAGQPRIAYAGRRFPTASGKMRFLEEHRSGSGPDPDYPLQLMAGSTHRWQTSQLTEAEEAAEGPLTATLHPESGGGIEDGGLARLTSRIGSLTVRLRHDPDYRRDTVFVPRARSHALGHCVNSLIRARLTDIGEGCAFLDEHVRVEPCPLMEEL
ncbi:MAG: molybdopterin-dependent oxidoreductase [Planctomycetota bacterium]